MYLLCNLHFCVFNQLSPWQYNIFVLVSYMKVSNLMNSLVIMIAVLYIYQRTFMKTFHPGHANWEEVLGIISVIASYILPLLEEMFPKSKMFEKK